MLVKSESPPGDDEQALHFDDETYILSKRWGPRTLEAADSLVRTFPDLQIEVRQVPRTSAARFDLLVAGERYPALTRRQVMFQVVSEILSNGGTPQEVRDAVPWRPGMLMEMEGSLSAEQLQLHAKRFFCEEGEIFHFKDNTFVLSRWWGGRTQEAVDSLAKRFPQLNIQIEPAASEPSESESS